MKLANCLRQCLGAKSQHAPYLRARPSLSLQVQSAAFSLTLHHGPSSSPCFLPAFYHQSASIFTL